MDTSGRAEGRIRFRLCAGVTGHRDLADLDAAAYAVHSAFGALARRFPGTETTEVRFELLSALAEGADRVFVHEARRALERTRIDLHAVLPLTVEEYLDDFESQVSKDEFARLYAEAEQRTMGRAAATRNQAYETAGRYIVDHSDLLVAIWDGVEEGGQGGTADIVRYARERGVPLLVLPAGRTSRPAHAPAASNATALTGVDLAVADEVYARTVAFNQGSIDDPPRARSLDDERTRLFARAEPNLHERLELVAAWALPRLVRADALAIRYQRWHYGLGAGLYLSAALAVTAVTAQALAGWSPRLALMEIGFMVALLGNYLLMRRLDPHGRWLGYRSLAEAFRSALFITMVKPSGPAQDETSHAYGPEHQPWFQQMFSEAWQDRPEAGAVPAGAEGLRRFLVTAWIEDQRDYHIRTAARLRRERLRINVTVSALFGLTVVVGFIHVFELLRGTVSSNVLVFLAVTLPAFGAALTGIRDQHQYLVHEERSRRTASRLEALTRRVAPNRLHAVQQLAGDVQAAIEAERTDWWTVSEFQRVEMLL